MMPMLSWFQNAADAGSTNRVLGFSFGFDGTLCRINNNNCIVENDDDFWYEKMRKQHVGGDAY